MGGNRYLSFDWNWAVLISTFTISEVFLYNYMYRITNKDLFPTMRLSLSFKRTFLRLAFQFTLSWVNTGYPGLKKGYWETIIEGSINYVWRKTVKFAWTMFMIFIKLIKKGNNLSAINCNENNHVFVKY